MYQLRDSEQDDFGASGQSSEPLLLGQPDNQNLPLARHYVCGGLLEAFPEIHMPAINPVTTSLSLQPFTSSDAGAWSNAYLISGHSEAILFDVFMLHSDAMQLADRIMRSGKTLKTVMISHAHPDHFMGLGVFAKGRVAMIYPGHGKAAGLELIGQTRTYLHDFAGGIESANAKTAEQHMLAKYSDHHVRQFLAAFPIRPICPSPLRIRSLVAASGRVVANRKVARNGLVGSWK